MNPSPGNFPTGIVPIVQTPFDESCALDVASLRRLLDDVMASGAGGLVYPAMASEVAALTAEERTGLWRMIVEHVADRIPVIAGVSSGDAEESRELSHLAAANGAKALLVQPTPEALRSEEHLIGYLQVVLEGVALPVILQDWDWNGTGLSVETILRVTEAVPTVRGIKVETVLAGPKYSAIKAASGGRLHVSGGWAVTQMLDGLARDVDAFMPEASMVRIYRKIWDAYHDGDAIGATALFEKLAPVLLFSNQHLDVSIQFFKRLLRARGIFRTAVCRGISHTLDEIQTKQADALVKHAQRLMESCAEQEPLPIPRIV